MQGRQRSTQTSDPAIESSASNGEDDRGRERSEQRLHNGQNQRLVTHDKIHCRGKERIQIPVTKGKSKSTESLDHIAVAIGDVSGQDFVFPEFKTIAISSDQYQARR